MPPPPTPTKYNRTPSSDSTIVSALLTNPELATAELNNYHNAYSTTISSTRAIHSLLPTRPVPVFADNRPLYKHACRTGGWIVVEDKVCGKTIKKMVVKEIDDDSSRDEDADVKGTDGGICKISGKMDKGMVRAERVVGFVRKD